MNYNELKKGLSPQKLNSYQRFLGCTSDKELIASYMVLQSLQEKFYLPIQLVELTLRNNINAAIYQHLKGKGATNRQANRWYHSVPATQTSKDQVSAAKTKANREVKGRPYNHNDVIARLTFGFWIYLLDKPHRLSGAANVDHQLWPYITNDVFPNRGGKGIPSLFNDLNTLNKLRNRLFHHEPIWMGSGVTSKQDALDMLDKRYELVMNMLGYLSPDKMKLVQSIDMINEFKAHCSMDKFTDYEKLLP
ncbi:hypothetical protein AB4560_21325 [Vibrio sp. 10N.222.51.C12]|uniref:hypothetical protein n=1 Tax=Vibrio sp. 10N.222.51.C12 TaxID=3229622 RepID=UPI00355265BA